MAELPLDNQPTLTDAELGDAIIALQTGNPKQWRKVTPLQLMTLLGYPQTFPPPTPTAVPLRGTYIARAAIPAGDKAFQQLITDWEFQPDIPSGFSFESPVFSGITYPNAYIKFPAVPVIDTQRGWYLELLEGGTAVSASMLMIGQPFNAFYPNFLFGASTGLQIFFGQFHSAAPFISTNHWKAYTVTATDDVELRLYIWH